MYRCIGVTVLMLILAVVCNSVPVSIDKIIRAFDFSSLNSVTDRRELISTLRGRFSKCQVKSFQFQVFIVYKIQYNSILQWLNHAAKFNMQRTGQNKSYFLLIIIISELICVQSP